MEFTTDWFTARVPEITESLKHVPRDADILEIGSWEGRSATWFLDHLPGSKITCVDTWEGGVEHAGIDVAAVERRFFHNMNSFEGRYVVRKGDSKKVLFSLAPESYDLVYVDGSHLSRDALSDIVTGWNLLKPGGVMLVDDYGSEDKGVALALETFCECNKPDWTLLHAWYQVHLQKPGPQGAERVPVGDVDPPPLE